jgi:hypothetical protein
MADEEDEILATDYGAAPPLPAWIDEPIYSDAEMYAPLGKPAMGPTIVPSYNGSYYGPVDAGLDWLEEGFGMGEAQAGEPPSIIDTVEDDAAASYPVYGPPSPEPGQATVRVGKNKPPKSYPLKMVDSSGMPDFYGPAGTRAMEAGGGPPGTPPAAFAGDVAGEKMRGGAAPLYGYGPAPVIGPGKPRPSGPVGSPAGPGGATTRDGYGGGAMATMSAEDARSLFEVPPYPDEIEAHRASQMAALDAQYGDEFAGAPGAGGPTYQAARQAIDAEAQAALEKHKAWLETPYGAAMDIQRRQRRMAETAQMGQLQGLERQSQLAEAQAAQQKDLIAREEAERKEFAKRRADQEAKLAQEEANYKKAVDDLNNSTIDQDRWMNEGGGYRKALAVIAGIFGGAVSGMKGGPNHALAVFSDAIDRDISSQKAILENKRFALGARQTVLGHMRGRLGDIDQAEAAARAYLYRLNENKLRALAADAGSAQAKAQVELVADLMGQQAQLNDALVHQGILAASQQYAIAMAMQRGGGTGIPQAAQNQYDAAIAAGYVPVDPETVVPGYGVMIPGGKIEDQRKGPVGLSKDLRMIAQARAIIQKRRHNKVLSPEDKYVLDVIKSRLVGGKLYELGGKTLTEAEIKLHESGLGGDFSGWTPDLWDKQDAMLGTVAAALRADLDATLEGNVVGGDVRRVFDPNRKNKFGGKGDYVWVHNPSVAPRQNADIAPPDYDAGPAGPPQADTESYASEKAPPR